nr:MAG TPA: hypothetical protein [Caudoviricetes sp.]DAJ22289.1 MAG TPA: hypothetical protein [Siphoviridae sp. ctYuc6]
MWVHDCTGHIDPCNCAPIFYLRRGGERGTHD